MDMLDFNTPVPIFFDFLRPPEAADAAGVPFVAVTNGRTQHRFKTKYVAEDLRRAADILLQAFKIGKP
jgi:hypothetical protein